MFRAAAWYNNNICKLEAGRGEGRLAINKYMRAALRALSYAEPDVKKNYRLLRTAETAAKAPKLRSLYRTWEHRVLNGTHEVPVRIFLPGQETNHRLPVLLFFHGGGWVTGNIESYSPVCRALAQAVGCVVASVDYRLAPEYPFPTGLEDCYCAMQELLEHPWLLRARREDITVIGDSAGGNLAAAASLMAFARGGLIPERQILIYPATADDHSENSPFPSIRENGEGYLLTSKRICDYMDLYLPDEESRRDPYAAPLNAPDLSRQPRTLVITAEFDPLRDEGEAYARRLREAGVQTQLFRMPDALHGFFSLPTRFSQVRRAHRLIRGFLPPVDERGDAT